jgi:DNA-binding NtrC family response regulator
MARIALYIDDLPNRFTMKAMLEAEGHIIAETRRGDADLVIADDCAAAIREARRRPALCLAAASQIPAAVEAMQQGVFGYIFLPLQPGEAAVMVSRALEGAGRKDTGPVAPPVENQALAEVEKQHILDTLHRCRHNQARTARQLGIGRNTLWRKLKKYGMQEESDGTA